mgnify:CR=1 FL=1
MSRSACGKRRGLSGSVDRDGKALTAWKFQALGAQGMRIAVVCAPFKEGLGYQENFWAEELARSGHTVRVFCAGGRCSALTSLQGEEYVYDVQRVPAYELPRRVFICNRVLSQAVQDFAPDLIVWFSVEDFFGRALLRRTATTGTPVLTCFGMNRGMHEFDWRKKGLSLSDRVHALGWQILRGRITVKACRRSHLILVTVPQTREILHLVLPTMERQEIDRRIVEIPLGFCPRTYSWNEATAHAARAELDLKPTDVVLGFSCRFSAARKEERNRRTLSGIFSAMETLPQLHAILVGLGDDPVSARLRKFAHQSPVAARVRCLPFAGQERLNELYNAVDVAIFPNASISCQAALGTGVIVCLADNGTMDHLIRSPSQGGFYDSNRSADLSRRLIGLADSLLQWSPEERHARREERADESRWLGYDRLCASVLRRVVSQSAEFERLGVHG